MVCRGIYSERIAKIYKTFNDKSFTYKQITKKIPDFKASYLKAMHDSNVIKLLNGKKKATGLSKKTPPIWIFTAEALFFLQK